MVNAPSRTSRSSPPCPCRASRSLPLCPLLARSYLVSFLGHPVVSGFTSAAAVTIVLSQLEAWLGYSLGKSPHLHVTLWHLGSRLSQVSYGCCAPRACCAGMCHCASAAHSVGAPAQLPAAALA